MKRCLLFALLLVFFVNLFPMYASANEDGASGSVIHLDDGGYFIVEIVEYGTRVSGAKSGQKTYHRYDSDGTLLWTAVLNGTFLYDGTAAVCTDSRCSVTIYDDAWYVISKIAGKSGNSATGTVTIGKKSFGITVEKETINLKLTCDANGNLN